jgi:leader peptidase (prepilin peptidase)/N-methyltransferase
MAAGAVYSTSRMIRILGTIVAGLLGLEFGSFMNVCLSRLPEGESIVSPRSHCRNCDHTLSWWENIPLLSWLALRGRCRKCHAAISWSYPLVELAIAALWAMIMWRALRWCQSTNCFLVPDHATPNISIFLLLEGGKMVLCWLLVALAILDAEHLWLPDFLTLPGAALGIIASLLSFGLSWKWASSTSEIIRTDPTVDVQHQIETSALEWLLGIVAAAALILLIRWVYWLIRRREGIGLGDVKLMVLLAAWLGPSNTLLAFILGVVLGASVAVVLLAIPNERSSTDAWALRRLPMGTFLCIGGIISSLWGNEIVEAYLRLAGL